MKIFVTGFHRAGSKTIAKHIASNNNLPWIEEHALDLWDLRRINALINGFMLDPRTGQFSFTPTIKNGFVLQCPFLAHKINDLQWYSDKIYWADRNQIDIITSMKNGNFKEQALFIIKQFHDEFPDDPYWNTTTFTNDESIKQYFNLKIGDKYPQFKKDSWIKYYKLVVDVKKHFLKTKFNNLCETIRLENLPSYDSKKHLSGKKPLASWEINEINKINKTNKEDLWL